MVNPDYDLDELFTELLNRVNLSDEDKIKYMNMFDDKPFSEKMLLIKIIEGKLKTEEAQREAAAIDAKSKRGL